MSQPTEESFLKDVSNHSIKILKDDGVYRHLQFSNNGSWCMRFDIVTWPGYLAYSGDMGCFVFSRLNDMFEFFRTDRRDKERLGINLGYWGEKLEAADRDGRQSSHLRFDADSLISHVEEILKEWLEDEDLNEEEKDELREEVQEEVLRRIEDGAEYESRRAISEFSYTLGSSKYVSTRNLLYASGYPKKHTYEFTDSWEWDCTEYTYRFIWGCYALAWGIQMYDKAKEENVQA